jgi:8-oxo-dGTP pyrophosphatase MutT (NUDIX family)
MGRRRAHASEASAVAGPTAGPGRWLVHGERSLYDSPWLRLSLADVELPDGHRLEHHVVRLKRAAIAAVVDGNRVLMMWRHRFVPDRWGWELPGGLVEDGEDPMVTAAREVEEETGWRPRTMGHLVTFQPMAGMVDSEHSVFIGRGADQVGVPTDSNEAERTEWISLEEVPRMIVQRQIWGAGTLIALLYILSSDTDGSFDEGG